MVLPVFAQAAVEIETLVPGVLVYSGPGSQFRPILRARKGRIFMGSSKLIESGSDKFYKVLVVSQTHRSHRTRSHRKRKSRATQRGQKRRVGYILASPDLSIKGAINDEAEEELLRIRNFAQAESSVNIQTLMWNHRNRSLYKADQKRPHYMWGVGYQKYLMSDFYLKGVGGLFLGEEFSNPIGGVGLGLDQNFLGQISLFGEFVTGGLWEENRISFFKTVTPSIWCMGVGRATL